jgi:hypothetical protein
MPDKTTAKSVSVLNDNAQHFSGYSAVRSCDDSVHFALVW